MSAKNCPSCGKPGALVLTEGRSRTYQCEQPDCEWHNEEWESVGLDDLKLDRTGRGFQIYEFTDRYGENCTLQKSSLGSESAVWFGTAGRVDVGPPWKPLALPDNALVHSRMHLTQQQVADLLPYLQHFAEHGSLPTEEL